MIMKAVRTVEAKAVNPLYSYEDKERAKKAGVPYDTPEFLVQSVGEEVDDKDAWILCVKGLALPVDAECSKRVLAHMTDAERQQTVADLKLLRVAVKNNSLGAKDRKRYEMLEKAYAVELGLRPSPVPEYRVEAYSPAASPESESGADTEG
jgi:hypothetical protein